MSFEKSPSFSEVQQFLNNEAGSRPDNEPTDAFLKRVLRDLVFAHVQTQVAQRLGVKVSSVTKALRPEVSPQLATICRIADAVGCEVVLRPRAATHPPHHHSGELA